MVVVLVAILLLLLVVYYMSNTADLFGSVGWHEIASVGWVTAPL